MNIRTKSKFWAIAALLIVTAASASAALTPPAWRGETGSGYSQWNSYSFGDDGVFSSGTTWSASTGTGSLTATVTQPGFAPPQQISDGQIYSGSARLNYSVSDTAAFDIATIRLQIEWGGGAGYSVPLLSSSAGDFNPVHSSSQGNLLTWIWNFETPSFDSFSILFGNLESHNSLVGMTLDYSDTLQIVPEPSTYALLGCFGLLGLVAVRRFRRQ